MELPNKRHYIVKVSGHVNGDFQGGPLPLAGLRRVLNDTLRLLKNLSRVVLVIEFVFLKNMPAATFVNLLLHDCFR